MIIPFEHTSAIRQVNIEIKNRVSKEEEEEYLSEDEGIPFEHTSAIREVNEQIRNRLIP